MNSELKPIVLRASLGLVLIFIGPVVLTLGIKIMDRSYIPLLIGIILCSLALYFGVTALLRLLKHLFRKN